MLVAGRPIRMKRGSVKPPQAILRRRPRLYSDVPRRLPRRRIKQKGEFVAAGDVNLPSSGTSERVLLKRLVMPGISNPKHREKMRAALHNIDRLLAALFHKRRFFPSAFPRSSQKASTMAVGGIALNVSRIIAFVRLAASKPFSINSPLVVLASP